MRFLADESCDFAAVRALRRSGHDVLAVSEFQQRSIDSELMDFAHAEDRILITEDKDFGWLAFVAHAQSAGVILIRFPQSARASLGVSITKLVAELSTNLKGAFVVLRPGAVRVTRSPIDV